ncbi:MAG: metallophosphatase [Hyphomicrobiales bacterium]|nr:MAG: metallophosphatase [Hyphomicrobiales bacterium]
MFRLAHLSDPHLGPLPEPTRMELASKRVIGYLNWRRNRATSHTSAHLDRLVADLKAEHPDHIAVTGDLVNLALDAELGPARAWLDSLGPATDVSVVPGNHDAYVPGAGSRALQAWAPFMCDDNAVSTGVHFPYVRHRGPAAIIGLSSARATAPFMATGHFDAAQARDLAVRLEQCRREGLCRIVLIHHPPFREKADWYRRLVGASRLRNVIRDHGAELVLHGHTHRDHLEWTEGRDGPVPIVGVPSASNAPGGRRPAARYNLIEIEGSPGDWRLTQRERGLTEANRPVEEIRVRSLAPEGALS